MPTQSTPTTLEWCASCDRFVQPTEHLEWHVGRTTFEARRAINEWRFVANQSRRAS